MSTDQSDTNTQNEPNFIRSAMAPVIRAGVMTAKVSWKQAMTEVGTPAMNSSLVACRMPQYWVSEPMRPWPPTSWPNARLKPKRTQITLTMPMQMKFCINIARTFLPRTMPP